MKDATLDSLVICDNALLGKSNKQEVLNSFLVAGELHLAHPLAPVYGYRLQMFNMAHALGFHPKV